MGGTIKGKHLLWIQLSKSDYSLILNKLQQLVLKWILTSAPVLPRHTLYPNLELNN